MWTWRGIVAWSWLALAGTAVGDGGPANYVDHVGYGGIAPLDEGVRLESGTVAITLVNDLENGGYYRAESTYSVENLGPDRRVAFGVPMEFQTDSLTGQVDPGNRRSIELLGRMASRIRIELDGRSVACRPRIEEVVGPSRFAHTGGGTTLAVCVAELQLPSRKRLSLSVTTTAFVRLLGSAAQIGYWLAPSGNWEGATKQLRITADIQGYAPIAKVVSPPGARVAATTVSWDLRDLQIGKDDAVKIQFPADWTEFLDGYGWVRTKSEAEVSSTGVRYLQLSDGRAETKWCGEAPVVFEAKVLRFDPRKGERCAIRGLTFSTDWIEGPTRPTQGPAVTSLRVAACGAPVPGLDLVLGPELWSYFREPGLYGRIGEAYFPAGVLEGEPNCLRVEVTRTDPRTKGRFCIGELAPEVYCRDEAFSRPALRDVQRRVFGQPGLPPK